MTRVLICGSRTWSDLETIKRYMRTLPHDTVIIHGAAKGADSIAGNIAECWGMAVKAYPAQWNRYHKAAGPIRNKQMLVEGKPDLVVAFTLDIHKSKGTANMVMQARNAGVPVEVHGRMSSIISL